MPNGGLPEDVNQAIARMLKGLKSATGGRLGVDEATLNERPFLTDEEGVLTDSRTNAEIWQEKADNNWFSQTGTRIRDTAIDSADKMRAVMQAITGNEEVFPTDKHVPDDTFGGTKTLNSPIPAPPAPKQDQIKFAQEASPPDRARMESRYMSDANARSQVVKHVTRNQEINRAPAWAQKFINAKPRRGGPQEF